MGIHRRYYFRTDIGMVNNTGLHRRPVPVPAPGTGTKFKFQNYLQSAASLVGISQKSADRPSRCAAAWASAHSRNSTLCHLNRAVRKKQYRYRT